MDYQKTFDAVLAHMRKQRAPALSFGEGETPNCAYRTKDGLKCAIGALIPDDSYLPNMEGHTSDSLFELHPKLCEVLLVSPGDLDFMSEMQQCHDAAGMDSLNTASPSRSARFMEGFERRMEQLAAKEGLTYTPEVPARSAGRSA